MLLTVCIANAQSNSDDFFVGKWSFEVTGMPQGDATMTLYLQRGEDGKLTGYIKQSEDAPAINLTRVDEKKGKEITAYFKASGYDCYMFAEKTGDNEVEGSVNDMFDAVGKKVTDDKK